MCTLGEELLPLAWAAIEHGHRLPFLSVGDNNVKVRERGEVFKLSPPNGSFLFACVSQGQARSRGSLGLIPH